LNTAAGNPTPPRRAGLWLSAWNRKWSSSGVPYFPIVLGLPFEHFKSVFRSRPLSLRLFQKFRFRRVIHQVVKQMTIIQQVVRDVGALRYLWVCAQRGGIDNKCMETDDCGIQLCIGELPFVC